MAEQIQIVKKVLDFAQSPGPRFIDQGPNSGEQFYNEALSHWFEEALNKGKQLVVILDGTDGYLTSFLDESFGRLVYYNGADKVKRNLIVVSEVEPEWLKMLNEKTFINWENRRSAGEAPKITRNS